MRTFKNTYQKIFQAPAQFSVHAPGRIEVLGNHTDYNQGQVLSMAIDRYLSMYVRPVEGQVCTFVNPQLLGDRHVSLDLQQLDQVIQAPELKWLNYIRGIIRLVQQQGWDVPAFQVYLHSDIPLSAGLSSSAALEMACVSALEVLCSRTLSVYEKARIGQQCEQEYMGARTGLMDQFTILSARKDHLLWSEYKGLSRKEIVMPHQYAFVLVDSMVKHDLSGTYNERRASCERVLAKIRHVQPIESLSDLSLDDLGSYQSLVAPEDYLRALHVVAENDRVVRAINALERQDIHQFGHLLFESHHSSRFHFDNSCEALDMLVNYAQSHDDCLGARLSGGGFGGMSIHWVAHTNAQSYRQSIMKAFESQYQMKTFSLLCCSADGLSVIHY